MVKQPLSLQQREKGDSECCRGPYHTLRAADNICEGYSGRGHPFLRDTSQRQFGGTACNPADEWVTDRYSGSRKLIHIFSLSLSLSLSLSHYLSLQLSHIHTYIHIHIHTRTHTQTNKQTNVDIRTSEPIVSLEKRNEVTDPSSLATGLVSQDELITGKKKVKKT